LIAKLDLYKGQTLRKELSSLAQHQLEDPVLCTIREELESGPSKSKEKYTIRDQVLHCTDKRTYPYWRVMQPTSIEYQVIKYVHNLVGHQGTNKYMYHISQSFYLRKIRNFISHCDVCQRVKHPNRAYEIEKLSHLPKEPGELMTLDIYGPLPTGRGGVKHLLVCLDVFWKHVALYP
jgi:hypothetical protein